MKKTKHIIWSNYNLDPDDWKEAYAEFLEVNEMDGDPNDENAIYKYMMETNADYLHDERLNLGMTLRNPILAIADLGLWYGRRSGCRDIKSGKVSDCLYAGGDYATWYVDGNGEFCCTNIHHDGTNYYIYREWKDGVSETQKDNLRFKLLEGTATRADITRVTRRIGDRIAAVYGWTVRGMKKTNNATKTYA